MIYLKLRAWEIFVLIITPIVILNFSLGYWYEALIGIIAFNLIFGWFLFLGTGLNNFLTDHERRSNTFFIINCFYLIIVSSISVVFSDGEKIEMPSWIILILVYYFIAYFHVVYYVSVTFISVQNSLNLKKKYREEIIFLSFFIFIVGLWLVQPIVREMYRKKHP